MALRLWLLIIAASTCFGASPVPQLSRQATKKTTPATERDCPLLLAGKQLETLLDNNPNQMNKGRTLEDYAGDTFEGIPLMNILKSLPQDYLIVENGPGLARAAIDIKNNRKLAKNGKILLIDRVKPDDQTLEKELQRHQGDLQYLSGKTLEQKFDEGSLTPYMGKADLVLGSFADETYGVNLRTTLDISLQLLKNGGNYLFNVQWMNTANIQRPQMNTTFRAANFPNASGDNSERPSDTFRLWLNQIRGADVEYFEVGGGALTFWVVQLKRNSDPLYLPPLITKVYDTTKYSPPRRVFLAPTVTLD